MVIGLSGAGLANVSKSLIPILWKLLSLDREHVVDRSLNTEVRTVQERRLERRESVTILDKVSGKNIPYKRSTSVQIIDWLESSRNWVQMISMTKMKLELQFQDIYNQKKNHVSLNQWSIISLNVFLLT